MGRSVRPRPLYLGKKLLRIRRTLGITQEEMLAKLGGIKGLTHSSVSGYELGTREPPLLVLLEYARIANVHLEVLADDNLDLPHEIPSPILHGGIVRNSSSKRRRKS
jgi:transcriptional regulator with XRE-family HTH domain